MATPQGVNSLTAFSQRYMFKQYVVDLVYESNPLFQRWNQGRRLAIPGGYQIEVPLIHRKFTIGGAYSGWDVNDVSPQDNAITAAWPYAQNMTAVSVDTGTLARFNSPEGAYDGLKVIFEQAKMDLADKIGLQLQSDGSNPKEIIGMEAAVDDSGVVATYAGVSRSTYTAWRAYDDSTTATLTDGTVQSAILNVTEGGQSPTIIYSRKDQYARVLNLGLQMTQLPVGAGGADEVLLTQGHTGALVMNIPWMVESHTFDGPNSSNSAIVGLNEHWCHLGYVPGLEFKMTPFHAAHANGQSGYTSWIEWMGQAIVTNPGLQFKLTNISA